MNSHELIVLQDREVSHVQGHRKAVCSERLNNDGAVSLALERVMRRLLSRISYDDRVVCVAVLPVLLTLIGLGVTVVMAWHTQTQTPWKPATLRAVHGDPDGYVQGIAKHTVVVDVDLLPGP